MSGNGAYARNPLDDARIYFEDDGGEGQPVVLHGGVLDRVDDVRDSSAARALPAEEFRAIYVDHRGLGRSDKPHDAAAYRMQTRVADAVAVLDELDIPRAHFIGMSWGGRLGYGIGQHAPDRVRSLVVIGHQPYEWLDSPMMRAVTGALADESSDDTSRLVDAFESFWGVEFPPERRASWADNDRRALRVAVETATSEGPAAVDLETWTFPCLMIMGEGDVDFLGQAREAAAEMPNAELVVLSGADHIGAHLSGDAVLTEAVLRTLRRA